MMVHIWRILLLMSFSFTQLPFCLLQETNITNVKPTLTLLVALPFPDDILRPSYSEGHSLLPAMQLAMEHVNNNSEILPDYTLDMLVVDSGCNTQPARFVLFSDIVHGSVPIAGIVGLPCSIAALGIAPLNNEEHLGVTQIIAGTSPELNNRSKYPITFGIVSSSLVFANAFVALIEYNDWRRISVFYESDDVYSISVYQSFLEMFSKTFSSTSRIQFAPAVTGNFVPLQEVENLGIRIIIAIASGTLIRSMLCLAYHRNMLFPTYQFVIMELAIELLLQEHTYESYHCTVEMMQKALNGSILTSYNFTSIPPETVTFSGLTFMQVQSEYRKKLQEYGDTINMTLEEERQSYQYVFYDAVWAYAMALNESIPILRDTNKSFPTLPMFWNTASEVIRDSTYRVQFQGSSGWISFDNETGHVSTVVDILQVKNKVQAVVVGYYNAGQPIVINDGYFVEEDFGFSVLHPAVTAIGSLFIVTTLLLSVALYAATLYYREKPTVKATAPYLNFFIFLGCCFIAVSLAILTVKNSISSSNEGIGTGLCNAYTWCFSLGYTLIFGTILVKSWRLYRIFFHPFKQKRKYLSNYTLSLIIVSLLLVDIVIHIIGVVIFPVKESKVDVSSTPLRVIVQCTCTHTWFVAVEFGYKGLLTLAVLCFAIINRRISHRNFRNTKSINILVYLVVLDIGIGLPTFIILNQLDFNINATYSVTSAMLLIVVFLCLFLLFLPPLIPIFNSRPIDTQSHRKS